MKPVDTIIDLLPQLSREELEQVKTRVAFLATYAISSSGDIDDWLLRGIITVASDRGFAEEIPKVLVIPNNRSYRGYRDKASRVRGLFEKAIPKLTKVEKATLGQLLIECLCSKLQRYRSVSFLAIMHSIEQAPEAFEDSFPGYLQMGLASVPIRGLAAMNTRKEQRRGTR